MKAPTTIALLAALLLLPGASKPGPLGRLGWLAGSWSETAADRWTEEQWTAPRGGAMLGVGRSGRGERMRSFEFMRIAPAADGRLAFFGSPGGAQAVAFPLVSADANEVVFENAAHDFPQRIRYRRDGADLLAEVSDLSGKQVQRWRYRRLSR